MKAPFKIKQQWITSLILLVLVVFISSCVTKEQKRVDQFSTSNNVEKLGMELMNLWETGDTLKTTNIFINESTYNDIANNQVFSGIQEINKYISHIHTWASEIKMTTRNIKVSNENGYIEWTLNAKQTKPIIGRIPVATNNDIVLKGVTIIEMKNEKIEKASDYMDVLGFVIQLGSKVELPGGMVIGEEIKDTNQQ